MSNESKKDFNAMMNNKKDMPRIVELDEEGSEKWGGKTMVIAPPTTYNEIMKKIPEGKIITTGEIRKYVAKNHNVDITCPLTAGIFIGVCAWASSQRKEDQIPYWRTLKSDGELNPKYPGGISVQRKKLEAEGHEIYTKGIKNIRYFVKDYQDKIYKL